MEYRKFGSRIVLRLDKGDEIVSSVLETAAKENIALASVYGIGGTDFAKVGVFNTEKRAYDEFELRGTHEITSLTGNINTMAGEPYTHLHITLAGPGGDVKGGHLLSCVISLTAEIFITVIEGRVDRKKDPELQINKFDFEVK